MSIIRNPPMFDEFSLWIADQPEIQPSEGITITDIDKVIHRYCTWENRNRRRGVQCMMGIEVKAKGCYASRAQIDTLYLLHQSVATCLSGFQDAFGRIKKGRHTNCKMVMSYHSGTGQQVQLKMYGIFFLRLQNTTPDNSEWMEWGDFIKGGTFHMRRINREILMELLMFHRHPTSFKIYNPARPHKVVVDTHPRLFS